MSESNGARSTPFSPGRVVRQDSALEAALAANAAAGLPQIDVSPPHGKLLHLLARMAGARKALEIGALGGYSAIWIARALPPDGRLVTLEADENHARVARENIARAGLSGKGRHPRRPGARHSAEDRGGGARAVRFRLHRRRQVEQCKLSRLGVAPVAAGNGNRRRQCRPGGPDRRREQRGSGRDRHAPDVRDDGARAAPAGDGDPDRRRQGLGRIRAGDRRIIFDKMAYLPDTNQSIQTEVPLLLIIDEKGLLLPEPGRRRPNPS